MPPKPPHSDEPAAAPVGREPTVDTTRSQAPRQRPGTTGEAIPDDAQKPKLPHERDESVDMTHGHPDAQVEQAYRDVERGLQDTDRGPPSHRAYQKQK